MILFNVSSMSTVMMTVKNTTTKLHAHSAKKKSLFVLFHAIRG